jgi:polyisoprenoid-binding protein YceI
MTTSTTRTTPTITGTYTIDPSHTRIGFVARHAMVTKVRGSFNNFAGTVTADQDDLAAARVKLVIQAESIDTRNADRDQHLRSNDFLAMTEHPEIRFVSTDVRQTGESELTLAGDLTIRGITRQVTIPFEYQGAATDPFGNLRFGFEGSTTINRKDFGVSWNAALETGGFLVSDKVELEFEVSLIKSS